MRTIMTNLYDHVTHFSSYYNIQTKGRDINSLFIYLIFKTSKQEEGVTIPLSLFPPFASTLLPLQTSKHTNK